MQFKGKTAIECFHHTVPYHTLVFDSTLSVLGKGEKPGLDGNVIIEGEKPIAYTNGSFLIVNDQRAKVL